MRESIIGGVALGMSVSLWTILMGVTGWYADPVMMNVFFVVVLIQIGILAILLAKTRHRFGYGRQVAHGLVASAVGAAIIFGSSLLFTTVLFPDYFETLRAVHEAQLTAEGLSADEIAARVEAAAGAQTPLMQALSGVFGTLVTGLVVSLILAIFLRRKKNDAPA